MKSLSFLLPTALLLLTLQVEAHHHHKIKCPWHSHYALCKDLCPKRCNEPKEVGCSNKCVPGCTCNPGYELNIKGKCVKPKHCSKDPVRPTTTTTTTPSTIPPPSIACPPGSHYELCQDTCPKKCNLPKPEMCDLSCTSGCDCDAGLELDQHGRCVLPYLCQPPNRPPNNNNNDCNGDLVADITVHIHGVDKPSIVEKHVVKIS